MGRGIALLFHDHGTRRGWVVSSTPWPYFTPGKDPVSVLQEAGWAPGPVWTGGKSRPHRDSIPDSPARSQSLYRHSYPAHTNNTQNNAINLGRVQAMPCLCKLYSGFCLTTEEKAWKNLSRAGAVDILGKQSASSASRFNFFAVSACTDWLDGWVGPQSRCGLNGINKDL